MRYSFGKAVSQYLGKHFQLEGRTFYRDKVSPASQPSGEQVEPRQNIADDLVNVGWEFQVITRVSPAGGGVVTGSGIYMQEAEVTVTAEASSGLSFVNWEENESGVSLDSEYAFTITSDRILTANFTSGL